MPNDPITESLPSTQFSSGSGTPILTITDRAFIFRGVTITDAGEAHKAFLSAMREVDHRELLKEVYVEMIAGGFKDDALLRRVKEAIQ